MKKSTWFLISGIALIVLAFIADAIISSVVDFTGAFNVTHFATIAGDAVVVIAGVLLILYSRKLAKEEKED
jgi:hypothetical protein